VNFIDGLDEATILELLKLYVVDSEVQKSRIVEKEGSGIKDHDVEHSETDLPESDDSDDPESDDSEEDESDSIDEIVENDDVDEYKVFKNHVNEDYQRHTDLYKEFHDQYLETVQTQDKNYEFETADDNPDWEWGQEVITYKERKDFTRIMHLNAIMGAPHNPVNPDTAERFEFWKYASKFNQLMSMLLYDTLGQ